MFLHTVICILWNFFIVCCFFLFRKVGLKKSKNDLIWMCKIENSPFIKYRRPKSMGKTQTDSTKNIYLMDVILIYANVLRITFISFNKRNRVNKLEDEKSWWLGCDHDLYLFNVSFLVWFVVDVCTLNQIQFRLTTVYILRWVIKCSQSIGSVSRVDEKCRFLKLQKIFFLDVSFEIQIYQK